MARRLTEEQITKTIISWLTKLGWKLLCFDFPQSGTGISLHPNTELRTTKNRGAIIPDVVAIKDKVVVFFENKDRFVLEDFVKVDELKQTTDYSIAIQKLLKGLKYSKIYYGVGLPDTTHTENMTQENLTKIDFAIFVTIDNKVSIKYQKVTIFS